MKKTIALFIAVLMFCTLCLPFTASAEETVHNHTYYFDYLSRSEDGKTIESFGLFCEDCDEVEHVKTQAKVIDYSISYNGWGEDGKTTWYFIDGLVSLNDPLRISGTVNLVLLDGSLFICKSGIRVMNGSALNIYSEHLDYSPKSPDNRMGKLRAYTDEENRCAAIGGLESGKDVTVSIYGGDIEAVSDGWGAAIGSGSLGEATVNIYGGKILARSTNDGAAIGGGYNKSNAVINFYGGISWAATTDKFAASVGCGFWECQAQVNFEGGYLYAVPHYYTMRYDGIIAEVTKGGNIRSIGKNDGLYDSAGMKLAEKAGWIEENGGYVASVFSEANLWIIIATAAVAVGGIAALVICVKKKKSKTAPEAEKQSC